MRRFPSVAVVLSHSLALTAAVHYFDTQLAPVGRKVLVGEWYALAVAVVVVAAAESVVSLSAKLVHLEC